MKTSPLTLVLSCILALTAGRSVSTMATGAMENWPQWRGPLATGKAPLGTPPLKWSETENVRWKVPVPGAGLSTPIVWGNRVFILTAIPVTAHEPAAIESSSGPGGNAKAKEPVQFTVLCYNRNDGSVLWRKVATEQVPHEGHHQDGTFASCSPVTDGEHLLAYFGSRGLFCYDMDGDLKWSKDFGDMRIRNAFGEGSSPALHGNTVVVLWDHEGDDDFLVALDKRSGQELWRVPRSERTAWTTPLIVEHEGHAQVIVPGTTAIRGYDLSTGQEIWTGPELTANVIPCAVHADGVVYAMSGFRGAALHAIQLGRTGSLADTDAVLWSYSRNTPYVSSPLLVDGLLYFTSGTTPILSCLDAKSGRPHYAAERLEGIPGIYASPVAAQDRVYVLGRNGTCLVLKKTPKLEVISVNKIDDSTDASMAIAGKEIFVRGRESLYCIARE